MHMAGAGAALDRRGGQAADIQPEADHLQQAGFLRRYFAIGGCHVAAQRIGRLPQLSRQAFLDGVMAFSSPSYPGAAWRNRR